MSLLPLHARIDFITIVYWTGLPGVAIQLVHAAVAT